MSRKTLVQSALCSVLLVGLVVQSGCESCTPMDPMDPPPLTGPFPGKAIPPRIVTPALKPTRPLKTDGAALPRGVAAHLPARDGDSFYVTLPATERGAISADEIAKNVLDPVLRALGFARGTAALRAPSREGVRMPAASLKAAAELVSHEYQANGQFGKEKGRRMIGAFLGVVPPDMELEAAVQTGEGMSFAQFVADVERKEIQYAFTQVEGDVPIEHSLVLASRWEGQGVTSVWGSLWNDYSVANRTAIAQGEAADRALRALSQEKGIEKVGSSKDVEDGPVLVLLPYDSGPNNEVRMRHAWRMVAIGYPTVANGQPVRFLLWMDAEDGRLLQLDAFFADIAATGTVYNRDPGVGTTAASFTVDSATSGQYQLRSASVMNRVNYGAAAFDASDVSIADNMGGSSGTLANFNQSSITDAAQAACASGTNKAFQQVNFFATIQRYYNNVMANGMFTPFPPGAWSPRVDVTSYCNANAGMSFGSCGGYNNAMCPSFSTGGIADNNFGNFAQDNTIVGHELAHNVSWRLNNGRPGNWCGAPACMIPLALVSSMHDLADAWADHFDSTNCTGGWVGKDQLGANASLNCARHDENGYLPRLHQVQTPFVPATPGDHFPEHRAIPGATGEYAEGQIGAAALWQVRLGMRSKCRPSGTPQYAVRFQRALRNVGFLGTAPPATDLGVYRWLYDLELKMVEQWATSGQPGGPPAFAHNGAHSANKVLSGFAKTGLFLLPPACLDADGATSDTRTCPGGAGGADAVVDIDDNETGDDLTINGVVHPETDFLRLGGPAPTFRVWTGPRYRLDTPTGAASYTNAAPCNARFRVEVANADTFPMGATVESAWIDVDRDPGTAASPECSGTFTPTEAQWQTLRMGGTRIYYRARTRDAMDMTERLSTTPGNGLWTVPPPYAVITADGRSDY